MNLIDYPHYSHLLGQASSRRCAMDDHPAEHRSAFVFRGQPSQPARNLWAETAARAGGVGSVTFLGYLLLSLEIHVHPSSEILKALISYGI